MKIAVSKIPTVSCPSPGALRCRPGGSVTPLSHDPIPQSTPVHAWDVDWSKITVTYNRTEKKIYLKGCGGERIWMRVRSPRFLRSFWATLSLSLSLFSRRYELHVTYATAFLSSALGVRTSPPEAPKFQGRTPVFLKFVVYLHISFPLGPSTLRQTCSRSS